MKKVLLLLISLSFGLACFAYETVIVNFPEKQNWHATYYDTQGTETILQYNPNDENENSWTRTVIFHSYKDPRISSASRMLSNLCAEMQQRNKTAAYKITKYTEEDSIATRCTSKYGNSPAQCEIFRVSQSHEGIITMHYINKNKADFKSTYSQWYQIMKEILIYYSYWRNDRVMNKATIFEI